MNPLSSVGTGELILILVVALIFLGPERLPEIVRSIGKTIRQFRDSLQGMSSEFGEELASVQEVTRDIQESMQAVQEVRELPKTLVSTATAPLMEAMEPVKTAVEEAKESVGDVSASLSVQAEETKKAAGSILAPAASPPEDSMLEKNETLTELELVPEPENDDSPPLDESRVVIEDDQT